MNKKPFVPAIQLYSVREQLGQDPLECLKKLRKIGFEAVEAFDLLQLEGIKPYLDDLGFSIGSSMFLWSQLTGRADLARKIAYPWLPKQWGMEYEIEKALKLDLDTLVLGYLLPQERETLDDYKKLCEQLNRAGELCRSAGLALLYHNHAFEFETLPEGTLPYTYVQQNTERDLLGFELDVLWAYVAGNDLQELMEGLGTRLKQLHLKTCGKVAIPLYEEKKLREESHDYNFAQGIVPMHEVLAYTVEHRLERLFVELEYSADMYTRLGESYEYLLTWLNRGEAL